VPLATCPLPCADLLVPGRVANVGTYPSAVAIALITVSNART
jgi:hypothetical protein